MDKIKEGVRGLGKKVSLRKIKPKVNTNLTPKKKKRK